MRPCRHACCLPAFGIPRIEHQLVLVAGQLAGFVCYKPAANEPRRSSRVRAQGAGCKKKAASSCRSRGSILPRATRTAHDWQRRLAARQPLPSAPATHQNDGSRGGARLLGRSHPVHLRAAAGGPPWVGRKGQPQAPPRPAAPQHCGLLRSVARMPPRHSSARADLQDLQDQVCHRHLAAVDRAVHQRPGLHLCLPGARERHGSLDPNDGGDRRWGLQAPGWQPAAR